MGASDFNGALVAASCFGHHLDIVKWCVSNGAYDFNDYAFLTAWRKKHWKIIDYLITTFEEDLDDYFDEELIECVRKDIARYKEEKAKKRKKAGNT